MFFLLAAVFLAAGTSGLTVAVIGSIPVNLQAEGQVSAQSAGTSLGYVAADAVAYSTHVDAVLLAGGILRGSLRAGEITDEDIRRVFPEDHGIAVAWMTAEEIAAVLEIGASHLVFDPATESIDRDRSAYDGFPQITGLSIQYDVSAPPGERLYSAEWDDGTALDAGDPLRRYAVAMTEESMNGAYGWPRVEAYETTGVTLRDALTEYIRDKGNEVEDPIKSFVLIKHGQRIETIGSNDSVITARMPRGTIALVVLLVMAVIGVYKSRNLRLAEEAGRRTLD